MRVIVRNSLFAVIILILFFFGLEVISRLLPFDYREVHNGYTLNDPYLFWKPHYFNDLLNEESKQANEYRIVALGDSCTAGEGCDGETYVYLLKKLLQEHMPRKNFKTYNLGVVGYSSFQALRTHKRYGTYLKPNVIIIYVAWNDIWRSYISDKQLSKHLSRFHILNKLHIIKLMRKCLTKVKPYPNFPLVHRVTREEMRKNILEMIQIAHNQNAHTIIIVPPFLYDQEGNKPYKDDIKPYLDTIRSIRTDNNVTLLDLQGYFANKTDMFAINHEEDYIYSTKDGVDTIHPSAKGHRCIANELYKVVCSILPPAGRQAK
ncbi:MAG: SGNH/GDSL hydrolase family protein [Candidatus Omnitrophica bacterium]|nr:SGNH/GDSL hydrolase family protein [Candidatus Omnitrophota bacterium]